MQSTLNTKLINQELDELYRQACSAKYKCYFPSCKKDAIESHILQRNGILSELTTDGHLYVLNKPGFFTDEKKCTLRRDGLKYILSYPLFCTEHDNNTFKEIEIKSYDIDSYKIQLLFSYRTLLAELRKKEINLKCFQSILDSIRLKIIAPYLNRDAFEKQVYSHKLGIKDLEYYKGMIERELFTTNNKPNYIFKVFKYHPVKICVSSTFGPVSETDNDILDPDKPGKSILVNIFPQNGQLNIIFGFCNHLTNEWISNYIDSWEKRTQKEIELKISDLITTRTDTWALSAAHVENNPKIKELLNYWDENMYNLYEGQKFNHNIFE